MTYIQRGVPPFLILYAGGEKDSLKHQSQIFNQAMSGKRVTNPIVVVPEENHSRIVLTLSRAEQFSDRAIFGFIERDGSLLNWILRRLQPLMFDWRNTLK